MILQLAAKSTEVQNLIHTNTHIPYYYVADCAIYRVAVLLVYAIFV